MLPSQAAIPKEGEKHGHPGGWGSTLTLGKDQDVGPHDTAGHGRSSQYARYVVYVPTQCFNIHGTQYSADIQLDVVLHLKLGWTNVYISALTAAYQV